MSISKMDWSRRNSSGAVAHQNNQQYLPPSTSTTVHTMPSHTARMPPNTYSSAQTFATNSQNRHILKSLLDANSADEVLKIQMAALSKVPVQRATQVSPGQYNSSYSQLHQTGTATNHQSTCIVQNPLVPNYQMQVYANSALQSLQQQTQLVPIVQQQTQSVPIVQQQTQSVPIIQQQAQSVPIVQAHLVQCYVGNGYNTREVQQTRQNTHTGEYSQKRASQQVPNSYTAKRQSRKIQPSYQSMQQQNPLTVNSVSNGSSGPYVALYKPMNDKNVPVSTSNYQNAQNIQNMMGSNYQTISHTNTLQPQQSMNGYVQNSQRQMMPNLHSGIASNSTVLPSTTVGQMPSLYPQSSTNASNVYNVSAHQRFPNPNQNLVAQNVQQPVQSYTVPQDQLSAAAPPPPYGGNVPLEQRPNMREIIELLKVYRNIKLKYLLLNRENNLMRQRVQSSTQDTSGSCAVKPPLISSLPNRTVPTNDSMGGQQVSQNSAVQSQQNSIVQSPSNTHGVQTPILHNNSLNISVHNNAQSSNSISSHVYPTNSDVHKQSNFTGFDGGQMNLGSVANSSGQAVGSETFRDQDPRESAMVSRHTNNQFLSSGNSSNCTLSQDGPHITSVQSFVKTTASSESCNTVHTMDSGILYANNPLTSSSREAIQASLPLWKSAPQSSAQNVKGYTERDPKHKVENSLNALRLLEEADVDPAAVTLTQKSELSGPNASKGIEPQIAIVSPLVQIKELVSDNNQCTKIVQQMENLANNCANRFKENDCLNKLLLVGSVDAAAAAMNNLEGVRPRSNMVSSSPCSIEVSSNCNIEQNSSKNDTGDDGLQISGICTLVEGNSFYDSSIALMFDGSLQTQPDSLKDDRTLQCSQMDINTLGAAQATSSVSPTTQMVDIKQEPQVENEPCVNDNQQKDVCLEIQPEQNLSASDEFDLESNSASDQLSELLTEFPFGIKNYISVNKSKSTAESSGKFTEKPKIPKTSVLFPCDGESDRSIEDTETEYAINTSTKEMEFQKTEVIDQQSIVNRVPTPELPEDESTSIQLEDGFVISDSPDSNIHITLLDKDQITELFPEDSVKPVVHSEESLDEIFSKESEAPVVDEAVTSLKEKSDNDNDTASVQDKGLFCCFFGWLARTNGNAPKCNCKLTEVDETEDLSNSVSQNTALIKAEPSADVLDPLTDGLSASTDGVDPLTNGLDASTIGLRPSFLDPCKTELEMKNEILPPVKRPKIEPIESSLKSKHGPRNVNCSPQEEIKAEVNLLEKKYLEDESLKEIRKNNALFSEKILWSKSHSGDPDSKKNKDSFSGSKSNDDGQKKVKKLIVKTDFLNNKHILKVKKKYKEIKTSRAEEGGVRNDQKINKSAELGESAKTLKVDKTKNEKLKPPATTIQQSETSMNKLKSSSSSNKSHSRNHAPSLGKRKERVKSRPESHFDKVKKVPTVQEYLERKRELYNKRSGLRVDQQDEPAEVRHRVVEKSSIESRHPLVTNMVRAQSPAKLNIKTKNMESDGIYQAQRGRSRSSEQSKHKKHRGASGSQGKESWVNKAFDQKITSSKEKIYLSPCDGSRLASCEVISLTKLQIRRSPEKPGYFERRKSLDSKPSKSETKNKETPKMLEFKLCPEFVNRSPSTQERKGEPKAAKEKSIVEGIKSNKEAWCSGGPVKKSRMDSICEDQGRHSPSSFKLTQKNDSKPVQDSQTTFNVFKQKYHEQRSKSLDGGL